MILQYVDFFELRKRIDERMEDYRISAGVIALESLKLQGEKKLEKERLALMEDSKKIALETVRAMVVSMNKSIEIPDKPA